MTEKQKDDLALALTNYLHREIIENCHEKYNISQEDMMMMNITSVNRARAFVDTLDDSAMLEEHLLPCILLLFVMSVMLRKIPRKRIELGK